MITTWLIKLGISRDSALWLWGKFAGTILFLAALGGDTAHTQYGIPSGWFHAIELAAAWIAYFSAQQSTSKLFDKLSAPRIAAQTPKAPGPDTKKLAVWLLPVLLAVSVSASGCAFSTFMKNTDATVSASVAATEAIQAAVEQAWIGKQAWLTPALHQQILGHELQAYAAENTVAGAAAVLQPGASIPQDLVAELANLPGLITALSILVPTPAAAPARLQTARLQAKPALAKLSAPSISAIEAILNDLAQLEPVVVGGVNAVVQAIDASEAAQSQSDLATLTAKTAADMNAVKALQASDPQ